jgi:hypothetical protein
MPLPRPEIGLVVRYGFVWSGADRRPPPDAGKYRPCLIADLVEIEDTPGRTTLRITYLPISHVEPRAGEHAFPIGGRVARHLGLTTDRSYLYTSYACEDDWPFDLAQVPDRPGRFDYGMIPPALFEAVAAEFRSYLARRPGSVHKRQT